MTLTILGAESETGVIDIVVVDGVIAAVGHDAAVGIDATAVSACVDGEENTVIDGAGLLLIPGVIDPHVHMRDLGQAEKETWETGSRAARAGGVTMVFDMPNSIPPTTNLAGLVAKRTAAATAVVGKRFFLGATPGGLASVEQVLESRPSDVVGIKLYMAGSSSNEVVSDDGELREYFAVAASHGTVVAVHAEEQAMVGQATSSAMEASLAAAAVEGSAGQLVPGDHGACRPRAAAIRATERALRAAHDTGATLYLCHVGTAEELDLIRGAKLSQSVYCEVTPHHAILDEGALARWGNIAKVNPPLRTRADRKRVVEAIADGTADTFGSDHAPHLLAEKARPFPAAPSGFPGLETAVGVIMTLYSEDVFGVERLVDLTSRNAASIFGLTGCGELTVGSNGDLTLIDPEVDWYVDPDQFESKAHFSPFGGVNLRGRAVASIIGGHAWNATNRGCE